MSKRFECGGTYDVVYEGQQHDTKIIMNVYVVNNGVDFAICSLRQHVEEIGKQVIGMIWFSPNWHGQTDRITTIILVISEDIHLGICLLQDACLYIMYKYLTLSHTPVS